MQLATETDQRASLGRAVAISLFTWRRAGPDDPIDDAERYGWWGDSVPRGAGDRIGSRLWLLRRRKLTADTLRDAETYAREALQWLIDDGVASALEIQTERYGADQLRMRVVIHVTASGRLEYSFDDTWGVIHAV